MDLEQRVTRLECENRRLKLGSILVLCVMSAVFLVIQARQVSAAPANIDVEMVTAKVLRVVDGADQVVGEFSSPQPGASTLYLKDRNGVKLVLESGDDSHSAGLTIYQNPVGTVLYVGEVSDSSGGGAMLSLGNRHESGERLLIRAYGSAGSEKRAFIQGYNTGDEVIWGLP